MQAARRKQEKAMSCIEWIETWTVCVAGAFVIERTWSWIERRVIA
jgi:hypothetical protein